MSEITTPALRKLISDFGNHAIYHSEMLSAAALVSGGFHDKAMMAKYDFDKYFIYQIVGNDPKIMADACKKLLDLSPFGININMSCPVSRIVKRGWGAALLKDLKLAAKIVRACRAATDLPLSVKIRSGFESDDVPALIRFATMLEAEGVDYIILHPRFAKLYYSRSARWTLVKELKQHLAIPIVGNGDIADPKSAYARMEETACDGIMIGRAAVEKPWIFYACKEFFEKKHCELKVQIRECFLRGLEYIERYLPTHLHMSRAYRFCQYYSKNAFHAHSLFTAISKENTISGIKKIIESYFERHPEETTKYIVL
ncbi:MAG: tRNA-dihydrouridine synthase family protein [Spirochaetes bacterium]|nr:tRNA-dihydrouridine synthase family protein [Spirochaetota bacterium]